MKNLNLGCGNKYIEGYLNIDFKGDNKRDLTIDLNKFPWPFCDNMFNQILMIHSLEHINSYKALEEVHRICKPNATIIIEVPFSINGFNHIQHTKQFNWDTFKALKSPYLPFKFELVEQYPLNNQRKGLGKIRNYIPKRIVKLLSFAFPFICQNIHAELKVIK